MRDGVGEGISPTLSFAENRLPVRFPRVELAVDRGEVFETVADGVEGYGGRRGKGDDAVEFEDGSATDVRRVGAESGEASYDLESSGGIRPRESTCARKTISDASGKVKRKAHRSEENRRRQQR